MPDQVFSAARLRGYRVLEAAGLGDALGLQILDRVIAGRLWLPFSLIEIGFRNAADRVIVATHRSSEDWLIASGREGDVLVAAAVTGPAIFRGPRDDGTEGDPIAEAARMAGRQLGRGRISRDDLIAHLMLGFWVSRCPGALARDPGLQLWDLIAGTLDAPLNDGRHLEGVMTKLLRMRNRVAHHEPLLFRAKHVFTKTGEPKREADLIASLQSAVPPFLMEVELAMETAKAIAPMASKYIEAIPNSIRGDIAALEALLTSERRRLREAREARLAARAAELAARLGSDD